MKLFGYSGSGKITLVEFFKCGLLRSFFRRRRFRFFFVSFVRFSFSFLVFRFVGRRFGSRFGFFLWVAFLFFSVKV